MHSLLMTAENGQKTYAGSKTQTRRILNPQPTRVDESGRWYRMPSGGESLNCYQVPFWAGERRYIREPHYLYGRWKRDGLTKTGKPKYRFVADPAKGACYPTNPPPRVCTNKRKTGWFRRPGMFMFEWAARSVVEITALRVQRVQEISEKDVLAEGVRCQHDVGQSEYDRCDGSAQDHFAELWDSIHGPGAWERNDWVVVVTYKRVGR